MRLGNRVVGVVLAALAGVGVAQERPDPEALLAAQREAMAPFAFMDGVWRGPAITVRPSGDKHAITQTERIGPLLGGTVKVIEGRGYEADGKTTFNALGIISYNVATRTYSMRSYAMGMLGRFPRAAHERRLHVGDRRRSGDDPLQRSRQGRHLDRGRRPRRSRERSPSAFSRCN